MNMRKLPNAKTVQFYGKSQLQVFEDFILWLRGIEACILTLATGEDEENTETPIHLIVTYE